MMLCPLHFTCLAPSNPCNSPTSRLDWVHYTGEKSEAAQGQVSHTRPCSRWTAGLGFESKSVSVSKTHVLEQGNRSVHGWPKPLIKISLRRTRGEKRSSGPQILATQEIITLLNKTRTVVHQSQPQTQTMCAETGRRIKVKISLVVSFQAPWHKFSGTQSLRSDDTRETKVSGDGV